jgi:hypothetical protein
MLDTVICIPTKRPPPIQSLVSYPPGDYSVLVVADPEVFEAHWNEYHSRGINEKMQVVMGKWGLGAQCAECYRTAAKHGFAYFFKMDDDLPPDTFVHKDPRVHLSLPEVIEIARECIDVTSTSLAGFVNSSRRDWLGDGFGRTYGLIHGGGNLGISAEDPSPFMDERLVRGEDIYRTCAHRARDGAVGRVKFIGFNKRGSTIKQSVASKITQQQFDESKEIILSRWEGMVTCTGTREIHNGQVTIPNWRMKK